MLLPWRPCPPKARCPSRQCRASRATAWRSSPPWWGTPLGCWVDWRTRWGRRAHRSWARCGRRVWAARAGNYPRFSVRCVGSQPANRRAAARAVRLACLSLRTRRYASTPSLEELSLRDIISIYSLMFMPFFIVIVGYFSEHERIFVIVRIQAVVWHGLCSKLASNRVGWQAVHVDFYVCADSLLRQELTRYYLHQTIQFTYRFHSNIEITKTYSYRTISRYNSIDWRLRKRIEVLIRSA